MIKRESRILFFVLVANLVVNAGAVAWAQSRALEDNYPRLGLTVKADLSISKLKPGAPAEKARLMVGDKIVAVEGHPVSQMTRRQIVQSLGGMPGTISHLTVQRGKSQYAVQMTRIDPVAAEDASTSTNTDASSAQSDASELDKQFIVIQQKTTNTDEIYQLILKGLAFLPDDVKRDLRASGVTIVVAHSRGELDGTRGGNCYQTKHNRVVITEINNATNRPSPMNRVSIGTLHELGHAYDFTHGRLSARPEFRSAYEDEAKNIPSDQRKLLAYFLEPEDGDVPNGEQKQHSPPVECFASLFAGKYYKGSDKVLDALLHAFPKTFSVVRTLTN